jgi:hypothetical protein
LSTEDTRMSMPLGHVLVANYFAIRVRRLWLLVVIDLASHALLDMLPHIEPAIFQMSYLGLASKVWTLAELGLAVGITFPIYRARPHLRFRLIVGFVVVLIPDFLQAGLIYFDRLSSYTALHDSLHVWEKFVPIEWWGSTAYYGTYLLYGLGLISMGKEIISCEKPHEVIAAT